MENRTQILNEYFQLRILLNRSNKLANEKTKIRFDIFDIGDGSFHLKASIQSKFDSKGLILAERSRLRIWRPCNYTVFNNFEKHICSILKNIFDENNLKQSTEKLNQILSSLE